MENVTANASCGAHLTPAVASLDAATLLVGQTVMGLMLRSLAASGKAVDVLNLNLALFHNCHILLCLLHLALFLPGFAPSKRLFQFLFLFVEVGGPMSLALICVERYVAVLHPTAYPRLRRHRGREVAAAAVWLCSLATAVGFLFTEADTIKAKSVFRVVPCSMMVCMISIMVSCTGSIARTLRRGGPAGDVLQPYKRRALRTVRATCLITLFLYTPVTAMQQFDTGEKVYDCFILPFCVGLLSAASVVHPLLYLATQRQSRRPATPPPRP